MCQKPFVTAIIVAAGNSTRMACGISKQLIPLLGKPVIGYTFKAFENAQTISEVVVVCRENDMKDIAAASESEGCSKIKAFAVGGATRCDSVRAGVLAASDATTHFAIHDGARALILPEDIDRVVMSAVECSAAALAVPVVDTVKIVDANGFVVSTPDRSTLRAAQTPQVFEKSLYMSALESANSAEFTDDCALVEAAGGKIRLVTGDYNNIKITTPGDVPLAEAILTKRMKGE